MGGFGPFAWQNNPTFFSRFHPGFSLSGRSKVISCGCLAWDNANAHVMAKPPHESQRPGLELIPAFCPNEQPTESLSY